MQQLLQQNTSQTIAGQTSVGLVAYPLFEQAQNEITVIANTAASKPKEQLQLLKTVPLGGTIPGSRVEYRIA
jgi:hypothetical protein